MAALEIAHILNNEDIFLIGSAISVDEINPFLNIVIPFTNGTVMQFAQTMAGSLFGEIGEMFMRSDPEFVQAMCAAVLNWRGSKIQEKRITRIHGQMDLVIKCPEKCHIIPGADHLVAISHSKECVDIIRQKLNL